MLMTITTEKPLKKLISLINSGQINEHQYGMVAYPLSATLSDNGKCLVVLWPTENGLLKKVVEHTNISEENGKKSSIQMMPGNKTEFFSS